MFEQKIENYIREVLTGDARKKVLDFFEYLMESELQLERGKGYWEDKLYWMITYKSEYVCFVLIKGGEDKAEPDGWVIWYDGGSAWFEDSSLDGDMKEIAWKHIDICGNCGGCKNPGGSHKTIFGKNFDNVCITTMRFNNPDTETVECVKKLVELRKNDIDFSKSTACGSAVLDAR